MSRPGGNMTGRFLARRHTARFRCLDCTWSGTRILSLKLCPSCRKPNIERLADDT